VWGGKQEIRRGIARPKGHPERKARRVVLHKHRAEARGYLHFLLVRGSDT
jgi:hypothetical protein